MNPTDSTSKPAAAHDPAPAAASSPAAATSPQPGGRTDTPARMGTVIAAAAAATVITLAATLFKTNNRDLTFTIPAIDTFWRAFTITIIPVVLYFLALLVFGFFGWLTRWWRALIAGAIGVLFGGLIGYLVQIAANGVEFNGGVWGIIFGEFFGLNFAFLVAGLVSAALVAPAVANRGAEDARPQRGRAPQAPVSIDAAGSAFFRTPSAELLADAEQPEDANAQWEALVAAFEEHGWGTQALGDGGGVAIGDTALVLGEQVILARGKQDAPSTRMALREALETAGAVVDELEPPALLQPADVVQGHGILYVGDANTNAAGVRALRGLARGYRVVAVPMRTKIPLSSALSILPDGTKLVWFEALEQPSLLDGALAVPEPEGAAVLALTPEVIAVPASAERTAKLIERLGYRVERLDVSALGATLPQLSLRSRD